jgi:hypothetical protein
VFRSYLLFLLFSKVSFTLRGLRKGIDLLKQVSPHLGKGCFDERYFTLDIETSDLLEAVQTLEDKFVVPVTTVLRNKRSLESLQDKEVPKERKVSKKKRKQQQQQQQQQKPEESKILRNHMKKGEVSTISRDIETIIKKHEVASPDFGASAYGELTAYSMEEVRLL